MKLTEKPARTRGKQHGASQQMSHLARSYSTVVYVFCGREKETQEILEHCKAGRLVVVTAHPGLGTTTLLNEGVVPALRESVS